MIRACGAYLPTYIFVPKIMSAGTICDSIRYRNLTRVILQSTYIWINEVQRSRQHPIERQTVCMVQVCIGRSSGSNHSPAITCRLHVWFLKVHKFANATDDRRRVSMNEFWISHLRIIIEFETHPHVGARGRRREEVKMERAEHPHLQPPQHCSYLSYNVCAEVYKISA